MNVKSTAAVIFFLAVTTSCGPSTDPATIEGGLNSFASAVLAHDAAAILSRTSKKTHTLLESLHAELRKQSKAIAEDYPIEHRAAALGAYPVGVLEAESKEALFRTLIEGPLAKMQPTEGLRYGMTMFGAPVVSDTVATALTRSGESVEFTLEDGEWRATVFENPLRQNLERIRINARTMTGNLKLLKEHASRLNQQK